MSVGTLVFGVVVEQCVVCSGKLLTAARSAARSRNVFSGPQGSDLEPPWRCSPTDCGVVGDDIDEYDDGILRKQVEQFV